MRISGLMVLTVFFLVGCSSAPSEGAMDEVSLDEARMAAEEAKSMADEQGAQRIFPDVYDSASEEYQNGMSFGEKSNFENGVMSYRAAEAGYMEAYESVTKAKEEATAAIRILNESIKEAEMAVEEATSAAGVN